MASVHGPQTACYTTSTDLRVHATLPPRTSECMLHYLHGQQIASCKSIKDVEGIHGIGNRKEKMKMKERCKDTRNGKI